MTKPYRGSESLVPYSVKNGNSLRTDQAPGVSNSSECLRALYLILLSVVF